MMGFWSFAIPAPAALAAVALVGYSFGRRSWRKKTADFELPGSRELRKAKTVIQQLEAISQNVRRSLATHHASIIQFKERIGDLSKLEESTAWLELSEEAERVLKPTLALSTQIAHAYDAIRQQTNLLMAFTEVRTDPLTGLSNRRAMEEALQRMLALRSRYATVFSLAILDLDHFKQINDQRGHLYGDQVLKQLAAALEDIARETDVVTRFGGEEFVVIMPETDLQGACMFCERLCQKTSRELFVTVSVGVAESQDGDTLDSLLARADTALYSAKAAGRNCVFRHTGQSIERFERHNTAVTYNECAEQVADASEPNGGPILRRFENMRRPSDSGAAASGSVASKR